MVMGAAALERRSMLPNSAGDCRKIDAAPLSTL